MLSPNSPWHGVLMRMLAARSSPVYMPAMVLALCDLADLGLIHNGEVQFTDAEAAFERIIADLPEGHGKAWQPFFHLSNTAQLWTLHQPAGPASFATLRAGRPKSRGALVKRVSHATLAPALWADLQDRTRRAAIAAFLLSQLQQGSPQRQRLGARAGGAVGRPFTPTPPPALKAQPRLITHNPAKAHAGAVRHHQLLQQLSGRLRAHQLQPLAPRSLDPQFDLGWRCQELHIIEIKSLSGSQEEHQLRLGLGQVLEYRHRISLREGRSPRAILAVERRPSQPYWPGTCRDVGVELVHGPQWAGLP